MALAFTAWRTLELEGGARAVELERAELVAERILRQAVASRAVMERVDPARRFALRAGAVVLDDAVGWLEPVPAAADADVVVDDRLDRAAKAEFAARDVAAARREFDELLAVPLPNTQRLVVAAAAAWQARRDGAEERLATLAAELDRRIAELRPAELGREAIATAVAAALRLPRDAGTPQWANRIVPLLPAPVIAGIVGTATLHAANSRTAARRELLRAADRQWQAQPDRGPHGLVAAGDDVLWWLGRDDGTRDGVLLPVADWLAAVRAAGRDGELPEWPWLVEPDVAVGTAAPFAGIPHLRGLRPTAAAIGTRPWLLPAATLALLAAFALAVWQQFRASRREAEAVRTQAEFLTTVTHELKTPLASIRLLAEMLSEGRAAGREADYYLMLAGEAGRLSMLIENVLDLGRLERGERAADLRVHDVADVVRETMALVAPVVQRDAAAIVVSGIDGPLPARIDRAALVQALISVLDNARKYGKGPIEVGVAGAGVQVCVTVRDHGPGVPVPERERIFERFVRGEAHRHGSTPGVGIGLYLARAIARRLHGELACGAPLDGGPGALFTLTLPMETPA